MAEFRPQALKLTHQLTFEGNWPSAVAFVGNDRLVAGNRDGDLFLWDLTREASEQDRDHQRANKNNDKDAPQAPNVDPLRKLHGHSNGITRLLTLHDGRRLFSASLDRGIRSWDLEAPADGETEVILNGKQRSVQAKGQPKNAEAILSAPGVRLETQTSQQVLQGHSDWVLAMDVSADGQRLISGDDSGRTILWDVPSGQELRRWNGHSMCGVVSTAISSDGAMAFVAEFRMRRGDFDRPPAQAKLFSVDDGEMLLDLMVAKFPDVKQRDNSYGYASKWHPWVGNGFVASAFSPSGNTLAVGQGGEIDNAKVYLIDIQTGQELRTISTHRYGVTDLLFSSDGKFLLTAGRDTQMRIVQVEDGTEIIPLGKPRGGQFKDWFSAIAISPDQQRLAAADIAGIVHVWNCGEAGR